MGNFMHTWSLYRLMTSLENISILRSGKLWLISYIIITSAWIFIMYDEYWISAWIVVVRLLTTGYKDPLVQVSSVLHKFYETFCSSSSARLVFHSKTSNQMWFNVSCELILCKRKKNKYLLKGRQNDMGLLSVVFVTRPCVWTLIS